MESTVCLLLEYSLGEPGGSHSHATKKSERVLKPRRTIYKVSPRNRPELTLIGLGRMPSEFGPLHVQSESTHDRVPTVIQKRFTVAILVSIELKLFQVPVRWISNAHNVSCDHDVLQYAGAMHARLKLATHDPVIFSTCSFYFDAHRYIKIRRPLSTGWLSSIRLSRQARYALFKCYRNAPTQQVTLSAQ